jgi:PAS domain S-box-containing protein
MALESDKNPYYAPPLSTRDTDKAAILIVDDRPEKLLAFQSILEQLGQHLILAQSGSEALKRVLEREFAVILLDVNMPTIDGLETAALIRQRKKTAHMPIIFITAYADEMQMVRGYSLGAVDYILAPVVPEILRAKVQVFVELYQLREQLKQQARAEQAQLAAIIEATTDIVGRMDLEGRLSYLNRAGRGLLGINADEDLTGKMLTDYQPAWASERVLDEGLPAARRQGAWRGETAFLARDGREFPVSHVILAHTGAQGELSYYSTIARDISASKALETALREANQHKDGFIAMLGHELRNPLAPIRNMLEVLRLRKLQEPVVNEAYAIMDRQVRHMVRLIDDLLDVSRITRGVISLQPERCDLRAIVEEAVQDQCTLFQDRDLSLNLVLPKEPLWVFGDRIRLAQVLGNLLHNARKFTPAGGTVTLSLTLEGSIAALSIRDNGVGIAPEVLEHVFEPFRQARQDLARQHGGLGLGLALARGIVDLHRGTVRLESEGAGRGTVVTVQIPAQVFI